MCFPSFLTLAQICNLAVLTSSILSQQNKRETQNKTEPTIVKTVSTLSFISALFTMENAVKPAIAYSKQCVVGRLMVCTTLQRINCAGRGNRICSGRESQDAQGESTVIAHQPGPVAFLTPCSNVSASLRPVRVAEDSNLCRLLCGNQV